MNIQYNLPNRPLRMLIVNPITDAGELMCYTFMRGVAFGVDQMVDLILLVYSNEMEQAEQLKYSLNQCGFPCNNSITITCDLPSLSDADVFLFLTDFPSLNCLDFNKLNDPLVFDSLYLLLKVANNLEWVPPPPEDDRMISVKLRTKMLKEKPRKPVIVADGLIALDILSTFTKNLPKDYFFSPTPISSVPSKVLGDYLKVPLHDLNRTYTWAANEDIFHVEVAKPIHVKDKYKRKHCEWEDMTDIYKEELGFDSTQFNPTWLKKEYIEKIQTIASAHSHGPLHKSMKVTSLLRDIWKTRLTSNPAEEWYTNCGVISDGSLNTIKGLPYGLPIIFKKGERYVIDDYMKDDTHLKREIDLINKAVLEHHERLVPYCNTFLETNVVQQLFLVKSSSLFESSSSNLTTSSAGMFKAISNTRNSEVSKTSKNSKVSKVSKISKN